MLITGMMACKNRSNEDSVKIAKELNKDKADTGSNIPMNKDTITATMAVEKADADFAVDLTHRQAARHVERKVLPVALGPKAEVAAVEIVLRREAVHAGDLRARNEGRVDLHRCRGAWHEGHGQDQDHERRRKRGPVR